MKKILITGGAGFMGSSLSKALLNDKDNFVVLVDNLLTGNISNIPNHPNSLFIKCDVNNYRDISSIMERYGFDYVFHYAAVVGVARTVKNPKIVLDDINGLQNIFMLSKNTGVKKIFFASSSEVYGEPVSIPEHEENTPLNSKQPYAVVKNIGECFCRTYKTEFNLDYTIFRFFNTYGPEQNTDFVISKFLKLALNNKPIYIHGDGLQTRTFCFIDDSVDFIIQVFNNQFFTNSTVNIGNDITISIKEVAELIISLAKSSSSIIHTPPLPEGDMSRRQPDISKMKSVLNRDLINLKDGIKKIVAVWKSKRNASI